MPRPVGMPTVQEMMTPEVLALNSEDNVLEALSFFNKHHISMVPVIEVKNDKEKKVIGILTQKEVMQNLTAEIFYDEFYPPNVSTLVKKEIPFAKGSWNLFELEEFFELNKIDYALVKDESEKLQGVISRRDIMVQLEEVAFETLDHKSNLKEPVKLSDSELVILQFDFKGTR